MKILARGTLLASCCAVALYGCGSSGDSDSEIEPTLEITRSNAGQVADAAYGSNEGLGEVGEIPNKIFSTDGVADNGLSAVQASGLLGVILRTLPHHSLSGGQAVRPAVDDDGNCLVSGTADTTFNDANNNNEIDEDESGEVDFDECVDEEGGPTINGRITFTLDVEDESEVRVTLLFDGLTIVGGDEDENVSADGSLTFGLRSTENPDGLVFTLAGDDLVMITDGEPLDLTGDFTFTATIVFGGDSTVEFEYTVMIDSLAGIVSVETTVALVGDPPEGEVVVEGVGSTLTMTFDGAGSVTVSLDENADGTPECTQDLTLDTLDQFVCP